jgi:hypothetical protein
MRMRLIRIAAVCGAAALPVATMLMPKTALASQNYAVRAVVSHQKAATVHGKALPQLSGATQDAILKTFDVNRAEGADAASTGSAPGTGTLGCDRGTEQNIRVNQDCTFRRQAEEQIAVDPNNPNHIIAGQNDSRVGYNKCGFDYSFDGGSHWGDGLPPFYQHTNQGTINNPPLTAVLPGDGHTYDAGSDPAVAFDSRGNAFFSCVTFDVNFAASGLFVTASTGPGAGSAYANIPDRPNAPYVVTENNDPAIFNDKEFITADAHAGSPFRDNVYVTWSRFECNVQGQCVSPIYFSGSTDHAKTWSVPVKISGKNADLCTGGDQVPNVTGTADECNFDQGSSPVVGPDGTISVVFNNGNTAPGAQNQQLLVQSHDAGVTWSKPSFVGADDIFSTVDGSQFPTCDLGRGPEECVPLPINARTNDFPQLAIDATGKKLAAVWQDFRNGVSSNENYDIVLATSTDGGATWSSRVAFKDKAQMAQFEPAVAINQQSGAIAVSYYDRSVNNDATTGKYDYSISLGSSITGQLSHHRVTDKSSLSPRFNPSQAGFLGDYSSVAWSGNTAMPIWSDGRSIDPNGFPDEDIFTARVESDNGNNGNQ